MTLRLQSVERGDLRIAFHNEIGKVQFLGAAEGTTISQPGSLPANATPEEAGRNFLKTYGLFFGLNNPATELQFMKDRILPNGRSMVRFQQMFASIPVFAGEIIATGTPEQLAEHPDSYTDHYLKKILKCDKKKKSKKVA